jgi:hypothetical protein
VNIPTTVDTPSKKASRYFAWGLWIIALCGVILLSVAYARANDDPQESYYAPKSLPPNPPGPPDKTPPEAEVAPQSGSHISKITQIVITFNESMTPASLTLGGEMAAESDKGVWSTSKNKDDTLTLSPKQQWNVGSQRTLTIDATDIAKNPLATLSLRYTVTSQGTPQTENLVLDDYLSSWFFDIKVKDNIAYVSSANGLEIFYVSDPRNLTLVSKLKLPSNVISIALAGNYAYLCDVSSGLYIVDISDPTHPKLASSFETADEIGYSRARGYGVVVSGNFAYLARGEKLDIIDVSNAKDPKLVASLKTRRTSGIAISGNYVLIATNSSEEGEKGIEIIDVTDKNNPQSVSFLNVQDINYRVAAYKNYAILTGWKGFAVVDITDVHKPTLVSLNDAVGTGYGLTISGDYAYVTGGYRDFWIIDLSDPINPTTLHSGDTMGWGEQGIDVVDTTVYIADGWYGNFEIIDVSNRQEPQYINSWSGAAKGGWDAKKRGLASGVYGVAVDGNYLYIQDDDYFHVADTTLPKNANPIIASLEVANNWSPRDIVVSGNYVFIITNYADFGIVDISDPTNPATPIKYETEGHTIGIAAYDKYVFVANENRYESQGDKNGLEIIEVFDPSNPAQMSFLATSGTAHDVAAIDNFAYLADGTAGLRIINVSSPATPVIQGQYISGKEITGVSVESDNGHTYAYITEKDEGLSIIDVTNPQAPNLVAQFLTHDEALSVSLSFPYAFISGGEGGVTMVNVKDRASPVLEGYYDSSGSAVHTFFDNNSNSIYVADSDGGLLVLKATNH